MAAALLLIDLQFDFLERPGLLPAYSELSAPLRALLGHARSLAMPVIHVRTRVAASGEDRMPHWKHDGTWQCVEGSRGVEPPPELAEHPGETVVYKQFFSGFSNLHLDEVLRASGVTELWVAGLYTHSCVRATAMDAYERGFRVVLVEDCLGSTDPLHASITLDYLDGRCATLRQSSDLMECTPDPLLHYRPEEPGTLAAEVRPDTQIRIHDVVERAHAAAGDWGRQPLDRRRNALVGFRASLAAAVPGLVATIAADLGKPRRAAEDELQRALGHIDQALQLDTEEVISGAGRTIFEPHGAVALVTPWNNPVAIPLGKLSAALVLGNSVVWKPAFQADNITRKIIDLLRTAGLCDGLVQVVNGGAVQVKWLVRNPHIAAVSLTGPEQAGRAVAALCHSLGKPLQAELGGNNALLVCADADIAALAPVWARLAFGFAGQRCTAIRRFVVERAVIDTFEAHMRSAIDELVLRRPESAACDVGPLISAAHLERVDGAVQAAIGRGARVVAGGVVATPRGAGFYYLPTLLAGLDASDPLVQEELFAPVAMIQPAEDFEQGLALVNGVRQGLLAGVATHSEERYREFLQGSDVGIVIDGAGLPIHPAAPFGGRKVSQIGPPEHGIWDREFFSRAKASYGGVTQ